MPGIFEVEAQDISDLNALNLTKLLDRLLHLEARFHGIDERAVEVGLRINVPDGGEDGRIGWHGGPPSTQYLPCRLVQFQNKATNMTPGQCANEIIGSNKKLKPMIERALEEGGAYIIFTTQILNKQEKDERVSAIRDRLTELGARFAGTAHIAIYDASMIQGWTNHYASAITAVLNAVGRPLVNGLHIWEEWERLEENHLFEFVADQPRAEAIRDLRALLSSPRKSARIIGLSGLGKTRLALEICRGEPGNANFSQRAVYVNAMHTDTNLPGVVHSWVRDGREGLIVVDDCDLQIHQALRREIERQDSQISLLTLHYNPEKDSSTNTVQLGTMDNKLIKSMLQPVYGDTINDIDRIVSFAQGFPQMAVLLATARLDQAKDMGSLTDDALLERMLWGGAERNDEAVRIMQACSLFDVFGLDREAEIEAQFIADNIADTSIDNLYRCIRGFEERGIVNRAGRFAQIIPKPLAIRLAADWWRTTRPARQQALIASQMPGHLETSFCEQISKLDFLPEVKELTEALCGDNGPFGQAEVILSDRGSRLFRSLVEVNPEATSAALYKVFKPLTHDGLVAIDGDVRRNLVWALEKLCFHENVFEKSAECVMWLADAENEQWANNATALFTQLFRTFLSGTETPPEKRLAFIDFALTSENAGIRKLAVNALEAALGSYGAIRTVGAEYQGSGKPLVEWRPTIWQEAFDYWIAALERLTELTLADADIWAQAKAAIGSNIRELMHRGRDVLIALDVSIRRIVDAQGPLWPQALDSIKTTISYDTKGMPEDGIAKLHEWISLLTPTKIEDRIALIVSRPPYEHEEDGDGGYIDIAARNAETLAQELSGDIGVLIPHLDQLLKGEQRRGYPFGRQLILSSGRCEPLLSKTISLLGTLEQPNIVFVLGLLAGVYELDPTQWASYISQFYDRAELSAYYPDVLGSGVISEEHLANVISLIRSGKADENSVTVFAYGRALDKLDPEIVTRFAQQLRGISANAAWIALHILIMYCYGDRGKFSYCEGTFKDVLVSLPLSKGERQQKHDLHDWKTAVEKILETNDPDFSEAIARQILASVQNSIAFGDVHHYQKPVMRILLKNYGRHVWPLVSEAIKTADPSTEFNLTRLFGKEDSFGSREASILAELPEDVLHRWCRDEPETAPLFVASATDVFIQDKHTYAISPRARFLIDEFGQNDKVLGALSANMGSFGWSGSVVPIYEKHVTALEPLIEHKLPSVREWANRRLLYLKRQIERERELDAEGEWGIR